jgi:hypothetical protein
MLRDFKRSITANSCARTKKVQALPELKLRDELRFACMETLSAALEGLLNRLEHGEVPCASLGEHRKVQRREIWSSCKLIRNTVQGGVPAINIRRLGRDFYWGESSRHF